MVNGNFRKLLYTTAIILMLITISVLLFYAPVPINPGERTTYTDIDGQTQFYSTDAEWNNYVNSFYIAYFHIPIALTAYLAFFLVFIFSICYLRNKQQQWDIKASASVEVGIIFAVLTPITGSIWAGIAWGHYWPPGDVRLNTSLVLLFVYIAYLMVRQAIDVPEKRARLSAIFGIIGFISVPISFLSIRLWSAAYHPTVLGPGGGGITGNEVIIPIVLNLVAFILMCISLIVYKIDNLTLLDKLDGIKQSKGL